MSNKSTGKQNKSKHTTAAAPQLVKDPLNNKRLKERVQPKFLAVMEEE